MVVDPRIERAQALQLLCRQIQLLKSAEMMKFTDNRVYRDRSVDITLGTVERVEHGGRMMGTESKG